MKRIIFAVIGSLVLIMLPLLDVLLKIGTGVMLVLAVWLPFGIFGGAAIGPWLCVGLACGLFLLGLWDCCDLFGLTRLAGWVGR